VGKNLLNKNKLGTLYENNQIFFMFLLLFLSCSHKKEHGYYEHFIKVSSKEINIIEHIYNHAGGTLYTIQKVDGNWKLLQCISLDKIIEDRKVSSIAFNEYWLTIGTCYEPNSKGKVFIFKWNGNEWQYYTVLTGKHSSYGNKGIAIFENQLLCGDSMEGKNGTIYCYDLMTNPPALISLLTPPESIVHQNIPGFGHDFTIRGDILLALDSSATFTEDDTRRYALTPCDLQSTSSSNDIPLPPKRSTYLIFQWRENHWKFIADLFHLLPHPANGILRNKQGELVLLMHTDIFIENIPMLTDNEIYLRVLEQYFVMGKTLNNQWYFKKQIVPPFPFSRKVKVSPSRLVFDIECIVIDDEYTVRRHPEDCIEIFKTSELGTWKPIGIYTFPDFISKNTRFDIESKINNRIKNIFISNNIVVIEHSYPKSYDFKYRYNKPIRGEITILEIDPMTGIQEVFTLNDDIDRTN
jgi:hypothetical protein